MLKTVNKHHLNGPPNHFNVICNCIQISEGNAEQGLELLLELPPNSINNTQRLEVLRSAFVQQSKIGVTTSFVQVYIAIIICTLLGHKQVGNQLL